MKVIFDESRSDVLGNPLSILQCIDPVSMYVSFSETMSYSFIFLLSMKAVAPDVDAISGGSLQNKVHWHLDRVDQPVRALNEN